MAAPLKSADFFSSLDLEDRDDSFLSSAYPNAIRMLEETGCTIKAVIAAKRYSFVFRFGQGEAKESYTMLEVWASDKGKFRLYRFASRDVMWDAVNKRNTLEDCAEFSNETAAKNNFYNMASLNAMCPESSVRWMLRFSNDWKRKEVA